MRTLGARFVNARSTSKEYAYFIQDGDKPKVGDYIITSVNIHADCGHAPTIHDLHIARIDTIHDTPSPCATKTYVHWIPQHELFAGNLIRQDFITKMERRKQAKKKLDAMVEDLMSMELYERLALVNPEARKLLLELED